MKRTLQRLGTLTAVTLTTALAVTAPVTTAHAGPLTAAVSGGGCSPHNTNLLLPGWDIGVCISNRGTPTQVYPDIYVNLTGFIPPACNIDIQTFDDTIGKWARTFNIPNCTTGHKDAPRFNATPGHTYHTEAFVLSGPGPSIWNFGVSPPLRF